MTRLLRHFHRSMVKASGLIGNPLDVIPYVSTLHARFSVPKGVAFLEQYWYLSFVVSGIYLLLILLGTKWMNGKGRYNLRGALFMWNVGLASFSIIGTIALLPNLIHALVARGLWYSVCNSDTTDQGPQALWAFLFILSKVIELGDTAFIILRKTPLIFLHWYHHITVLIFTWYVGFNLCAIGQWFIIMNLCVHSVMYTYYALKAYGVRVPNRASLLITTLQLLQMVFGVVVSTMSYISYRSGVECALSLRVFYASAFIYSSYAVLFAHFFYNRYLSKTKLN